MAGKSVEDYWNTSHGGSFNFDDDNEQDKGVAFSETFDSLKDPIFNFSVEENNTRLGLPIHSLITKRNLDSVLADIRIPFRNTAPPVQETILKMFLGMPYSLHYYRSLDQKLELLDEAVGTEDGNIILTVLMHLKKSFKLSILLFHLSKRKIALQHYTSYLKQELRLEELADVYMFTGNYSDVVYLFYLASKGTTGSESLHIKLLRFLGEHQGKLHYDKAQMFTDYKAFIKLQMDSKLNTRCVIEHLANICKLAWEKSGDNKSSDKVVTEFKQTLKISDFQYEWTLLNVLGALKMWKTLTTLFIKPNWLTKKNAIKSVIEPELLVSTLHKHDAPKQNLEEFLGCITDNEIGLRLAKKMKCHKYIIDLYIAQRDRLAIISYKENIPNQSEECFYVESVLRASDKKWKN